MQFFVCSLMFYFKRKETHFFKNYILYIPDHNLIQTASCTGHYNKSKHCLQSNAKDTPCNKGLASVNHQHQWEQTCIYGIHLEKKSLPLSSTTMKAGKFSTSIFHTASMPSSGNSCTSTFFMQFCARMAAGPPMEPR
jgi:hypothetical protein